MEEIPRSLADLYGRVLLEVLSGPYSDVFAAEVGRGTNPIWRALLQRQDVRLIEDRSSVPVDDIDWAAIRVIAPVMRRLYDEAELHLMTGHHSEELAELEKLAISMRREYRTPRHAISYQIGDCTVELPTAYIWQGVELAAAPDPRSWDRVMPECARGRRDEFIEPLRRNFEGSGSSSLWEERPVESLDELRAWVTSQARSWKAEKARRMSRPREPRPRP